MYWGCLALQKFWKVTWGSISGGSQNIQLWFSQIASMLNDVQRGEKNWKKNVSQQNFLKISFATYVLHKGVMIWLTAAVVTFLTIHCKTRCNPAFQFWSWKRKYLIQRPPKSCVADNNVDRLPTLVVPWLPTF